MNADDVRAFARERVLATLPQRYEERTFSWELWHEMADQGLFGLLVPEELGGSGLGAERLLDAIDAFLVEGCDLGLCLSWLDHVLIHTHVIQRFGTAAQRAEIIPRLTRGDHIGALAASEPGTGANPEKMKTTARASNGGFTIRGHKIFITNGPVADRVIVLARTGPRPGKEGISAFLVDTASAGFQVRQVMDLGFLHTSPHGELVFEDCHVPAENLLGGIGQGHVGISRAVFSWERYVLLYAMAVHFRALLDRWIRSAAGLSGSGMEPIGTEIASAHVTLEGLREVARLRAVEALERTGPDRKGMERLLFLGHAFHRWWEGFEALLRRGMDVPEDPVFSILRRDAGLLHIDRRLRDAQLARIGRELLRSGAPRDDTEGH